MKIAILSFYYGQNDRGAENWTKELSKRLHKQNAVTIFSNKNSNLDLNKRHGELGIMRRLFLDYWSRKILGFTLKIIPQLSKDNFDIIIPTNGGWQPILIRIFSWFKGKKMMVVGHSGIGWDDRINLWIFPDAFVALTKKAHDWAKLTNPFIKVKEIPNGVDLDKFSKQGSKINIPLKHPIVLCCSALVRSKRIDLIIKAVAATTNVSLLIVGKGELESELTEFGQKLLGKRFYITKKSYEQMPKVYRTCDLFTLPSWDREAFGIVYLEAMACGLGIVAPDDASRREIVGDAGILVDIEDEKKYVDTIGRALNIDWSIKARKQAEKFSWDKVAKKYEQLMLEIIQK